LERRLSKIYAEYVLWGDAKLHKQPAASSDTASDVENTQLIDRSWNFTKGVTGFQQQPGPMM
jgi:hypothetical protein